MNVPEILELMDQDVTKLMASVDALIERCNEMSAWLDQGATA